MFSGWKAHYEMEPIVSCCIDFYKIEFLLNKEESEIKELKEYTTREHFDRLEINI